MANLSGQTGPIGLVINSAHAAALTATSANPSMPPEYLIAHDHDLRI
jgi:hypothetical protein